MVLGVEKFVTFSIFAGSVKIPAANTTYPRKDIDDLKIHTSQDLKVGQQDEYTQIFSANVENDCCCWNGHLNHQYK